jgi:hypothetical protein
MPVTYYCPFCWHEVGRELNCPQCGADVRDCADESYEQKLIRALRHPEPTVPFRAAKILGVSARKVPAGPLSRLRIPLWIPTYRRPRSLVSAGSGTLRLYRPLIVPVERACCASGMRHKKQLES